MVDVVVDAWTSLFASYLHGGAQQQQPPAAPNGLRYDIAAAMPRQQPAATPRLDAPGVVRWLQY